MDALALLADDDDDDDDDDEEDVEASEPEEQPEAKIDFATLRRAGYEATSLSDSAMYQRAGAFDPLLGSVKEPAASGGASGERAPAEPAPAVVSSKAQIYDFAKEDWVHIKKGDLNAQLQNHRNAVDE